MRKKTRNFDLNFSINNYCKDNFITLFNCYICGFHPKVIYKKWIKGFEEQCSVQILKIHPEKYKIIKIINDQNLTNDGHLIEELICGKCGGHGRMEDVPKSVLKSHGFRLSKTESNQKTKQNNSSWNKIKKIIKRFK